MSLKEDIDALATDLLKAATTKAKKGEEGMHTRERVDIFKAVSTWHLGSTKTPKGGDDDQPPRPGGSFDTIRQRVNGAG